MKSIIYKITFIPIFILGFNLSQQAQELKKIQLLLPDMSSGKSLMQSLKERKSSREFSEKDLPLQEISNLLWAANGINRTAEGKHTAPTARNWQDIDVYVVMKEAVYIYDPLLSELKPVNAGDFRASAGTQDYVSKAPVNLVFVSDYSRMKDAKEDSKASYAASDAAFIAQNVYLYCASVDLAVVVRASFDKEKLAVVLKLNPDQHIVLAQTVGYPK
jgi:SagB-type dehydrogenase family enzyme